MKTLFICQYVARYKSIELYKNSKTSVGALSQINFKKVEIWNKFNETEQRWMLLSPALMHCLFVFTFKKVLVGSQFSKKTNKKTEAATTQKQQVNHSRWSNLSSSPWQQGNWKPLCYSGQNETSSVPYQFLLSLCPQCSPPPQFYFESSL